MLSLINTRLTIIEVQLKMKISTNDSIIIVYMIFLRVQMPQCFSTRIIFSFALFFIILSKLVKNEYETKRKVLQTNQEKISSFESITSVLLLLTNIIFSFELFQHKIFAIRKQKKLATSIFRNTSLVFFSSYRVMNC